MGVRINLDNGEMGRLLASDQMRPPLRAIAQEKAATARSTAPVDQGTYRDSIDVVSDTTDRAVERVVAHNSKSIIIESRTGNLRRALGG